MYDLVYINIITCRSLIPLPPLTGKGQFTYWHSKLFFRLDSCSHPGQGTFGGVIKIREELEPSCLHSQVVGLN